jgi:hypothetical protein
MTRHATIAACLLLAGCSTNGGSRWYAPATWFSGAPATATDKAEKKEDAAREKVIISAQKSAHETDFALAAAPASRPVEVARDSSASTVQLLDQVAGPMTAADLSAVRRQVQLLVSENAKLREQGESMRQDARQDAEKLSRGLAEAEAKTEAAGKALRAAFERENALANDLRAQRAQFWIAAGVAVLLALGWLYAKIMLGGVAGGLGKLLAHAETSLGTEAASNLRAIADSRLNRNEQAAVRAAYEKAKP